MKTIAHGAAWLCAFLLAGCDYQVPLVEKPELPLDPALIGQWKRTDNGQTFRLAFLPLEKNEYLVFYQGRKGSLFARACLCRTAGGLTLLQGTMLGVAQEGRDDVNLFKNTYLFAAYTIQDDTLSFRFLDLQTIQDGIDSTAALAAAIEADKDNPELFQPPMLFTKATKQEDPPTQQPPPARPPIPEGW
jgi:hypothetical protein